MWLRVAIGATMISAAILPTAAWAQQKTVKACQEEWRASKAEYQAKGITEKAYVEQCRSGAAPAARPTASSPAPAPAPAAPPASTAQGKTVKACQDEWRANKAGYQAANITEKAYVEKCRAGEQVALPSGAASPPPATPAAATPAPAAPAAAGKTVKACQEEWRANKAAYQAANITEKAYVEKCRAGEQVALPSGTPSPPPAAPAAATPAPAPAPAAASPPAKPAPVAAAPSNPTGAGQFAAEAQAKAHCPADIVVWVNLKSKVYHFSGYKNYGHTEEGAYMCEKEATAQGFRATKNEKRPGA